MRKPRPKIRRAQPSDEMEKGPYYDSDFEESELESESESESEGAFVVDEELGDCDADEHTTFPQLKVPFDAFLYDFCNVSVYNKRENVDDEVIREEGHSDNEIEDDKDEVDQDPTKFSVHDPSVCWKKMKQHLGEKYANQIELRFRLTNYAVHNGYPIKGKAKAYQSVRGIHEGSSKDFEDEGLQNVILAQDLKGDAHATEFLASGYSEDEVYHVLYEQHLDVEVLAEVPPILEPLHEEVPEVEQVQPVPEEVPQVGQVPPVPQVDIVLETEDEGIVETPPSQRLMRTRSPSERITKIQIGMKAAGKKVVGPGRSRLDPVSLE
ncbi:unnamed protein product [Lactuca virosa]|uniref:Transposase MuDR plant domain-containing protein n=1 Tax=Lactuca virosa TaxID=75947 RepID=A0AAU9PSP5_9ASTR|nr:unnamed protein product [Lactuca virosa]